MWFSLLAAAAQAQEASDTGSSIPGIPGEDYPLLAAPLDTSFLCDGREVGYYADPEGECQQFHICVSDGLGGPSLKFSFLCPNGTLFNQQYFICDWWFNVDCSQVELIAFLQKLKASFCNFKNIFQAENFYFLNEQVAEAAALANQNRYLFIFV